MKSKLLCILLLPFVYWRYVDNDSDILAAHLKYPQGWYFVSHNKTIRKIIQYVCSSIGGHELSNTEWTYSGGDYVNRHCRWCDHIVPVPKAAIYFLFHNFQEAQELMKYHDILR